MAGGDWARIDRRARRERRGRAETGPERKAVYHHVFVAAFRAKYMEGAAAVEITEADLRAAARALMRPIRRFPDFVPRILRTVGLPAFVRDRGFTSVDVVEKGVYRLTREGDDLDLSAIPLEGDRVLVATKVPSLIARHLRLDEHSIMSAVAHARALEEFFGHPCHLLQAEMQATGPAGEPFGADYFFLLEDRADDVCIPVTVRGQGERWMPAHPVRSAVRAALVNFPGLEVRPVSVWMDEERRILVAEYRWRETEKGRMEIEGLRRRRYRFEPQLLAWRR